MLVSCLDGRAATVAFAYDGTGNQIVQQPATASAPAILSQTNTQVVAMGNSASFSINVVSVLPVTFQWSFNGAAISGATGDTLLITNASAASQGSYAVTVTNSLGSVASSPSKLYVTVNPAAFLYWTSASGDFNNPVNWSGNRVPGPADTAVIDSGTFALPASGTITAGQVTIFVPFAAATGADTTLSITGAWTFNGAFTLATGRRFTVSGGGSARVLGPTALNGASLLASGGSKLTFAALPAYAVPAGAAVQWTADGANSVLTFQNLATLVGNATPNCYFDLTAQNNGTISLPALASISKPDDGDASANSGVRLTASGGTISAPGLASFQDNDSHPGSSITASGGGTLVLTNLAQSGLRGVTINGVVVPVYLAPVINSATTAVAYAGQPFTYQVTATNSPGSYGASGLPIGLSINPATGLVSGTPTQTGVYRVGLSAGNAGGTGTLALTLTVDPNPVPPPVIASPLTANAQVTVAFAYQIAASNTPSVYGASGLPGGLAINTASGLISGTPATVGSYQIGLSATNSGGVGTATLLLNIAVPPVVFPTIISPTSDSTIVGYAYGYQIIATNTPTSYAASGLPAGLTVNTASGLISGTPTGVGIFHVSLSATNAGGTGTATLTLAVNAQPLPAPVINSVLSVNGQATVPLSYQITASNSPVSFNAGGLPAGVSVNTASGLISGVPAAPGVYSIALAATNAGGTGTATLTLTVGNPPMHPAFFSGETALAQGTYYLQFPTGNPFGYYAYLSDPRYIFHFDLGYEYVFDAADGRSGIYLYDFKSNGFFYTAPGFPFPYLYDFSLNTTVYYYPDPNNPQRYNTNGVRYFYRFDTGQIFAK